MSSHTRSQLRTLRWAQNSICAACGQRVPSAAKLPQHHPDAPTFDHVVPRSAGGGQTLDNGLLKHRRCNQQRGNAPPTEQDLSWLAKVRAKIKRRPRSLKATFKGGVRNPAF